MDLADADVKYIFMLVSPVLILFSVVLKNTQGPGLFIKSYVQQSGLQKQHAVRFDGCIYELIHLSPVQQSQCVFCQD